MQPYLIVIIVLASLFVLLLAIAFLCDKFAFGKRCDKNPNLKYFTAEDFSLSAEQITLPKGLK